MIDFPIEKIEINFLCKGTAGFYVDFNDVRYDNFPLVLTNFKENNKLQIFFSKDDPADELSFAVLDYFKVNGGNFNESFKLLDYTVDHSKHKDAPSKITNNGYFGYNGSLTYKFKQCDDLLKKAAWLIADRNFENPKDRSRGNLYRQKNFETVLADAKYMFTGSWPPDDDVLRTAIDSHTIKDTRLPIVFDDAKRKIENWIKDSKRLKLSNFAKFKYFSFDVGATNFIDSFVDRGSENINLPDKKYAFIGDCLAYRNVKQHEKHQPGSHALFEFPNPWQDGREVLTEIRKAKQQGCYIAVDLTWFPIMKDPIELDLDLFDEVYFSMNKTWPISHLRPAWRWSKERIDDRCTWLNEWNYYQKVEANIFLNLIKQFPIDYTWDKYVNNVNQVNNLFNLSPTDVLWFSTHPSVTHDTAGHISPHYNLDEFVCVRKLLNHMGEHFW